MCNNCNCDFYTRCSIIGFMPPGFCCENCFLYDEDTTCLKTEIKEVKKQEESGKVSKIRLIEAKIKKGLLEVVIVSEEEKKRTLLIDLKKYLESS